MFFQKSKKERYFQQISLFFVKIASKLSQSERYSDKFALYLHFTKRKNE